MRRHDVWCPFEEEASGLIVEQDGNWLEVSECTVESLKVEGGAWLLSKSEWLGGKFNGRPRVWLRCLFVVIFGCTSVQVVAVEYSQRVALELNRWGVPSRGSGLLVVSEFRVWPAGD